MNKGLSWKREPPLEPESGPKKETIAGERREENTSVLFSKTDVAGPRRREPGIAIRIQEQLAEALEAGGPWLLEAIQLPGLDGDAASWVCERVLVAYDGDEAWTADASPYDLAASVLDDMARKDVTFTCRKFAQFMTQAIKVRSDATGLGDYDEDAVSAALRVYGDPY